jgi:hypothetical protein
MKHLFLLSLLCCQLHSTAQTSRSILLAQDFNVADPLFAPQAEASVASWDAHAGVIEKQGSGDHTGAVKWVTSSPLKPSRMLTGLLAVACPENDLHKLSLAFDLCSSSAQTVQVNVESYNHEKHRTGGRQGMVYPAAPHDYQRHVLDLGEMKAMDGGDFLPNAPFLQVTFTISQELGWPAEVPQELHLDNLSYTAPACYVSPTGSDKNDGLSAEKPLASVAKAVNNAKPGDVILLMNGTFQSKYTLADFKHGGTPAAWITLRNHPGHHPILKAPDWNLIKIGLGSKPKPSEAPAIGYIDIHGLTIEGVAEEVEVTYKADVGKPLPTTNGNGISVDGRFQAHKPHHIRMAQNEVRHCPGGGISCIHSDYLQIEQNHTHNNCHWMIYAGSGISVYQPFNFDTITGGHKVLIRQNQAHHNYCTQPWVTTGKPSDGNGIIIDDCQNHQNNSTNGVYAGGILLQANLSYNNGGSGMHCYASDHVDFINNTVVNNSNVVDYGQLSVTACDHVRVLNNILVAAADKPMNKVNGAFHDVVLSHNLFSGGTKEIVLGDDAIQADPQFQDPATHDYRLSNQSPAQKAAKVHKISPLLDLVGKPLDTKHPSLGALQ